MKERRASNDRKSISLLVKLAHKGLDEFAEKYATNLSPGGMFIRSRQPAPMGTVLQFRIEIAGGTRVLQGRAIVKWVRGPDDPAGPQGMGLEFQVLDASSAALVERMLGSTAATGNAVTEPVTTGLGEAPPSIAPLIAPATVRTPPAAPPPPPEDDIEELPAELLGHAGVDAASVDIDFDSLVTDTPEPLAPSDATDDPFSPFELDVSSVEAAPPPLDIDSPFSKFGVAPAVAPSPFTKIGSAVGSPAARFDSPFAPAPSLDMPPLSGSSPSARAPSGSSPAARVPSSLGASPVARTPSGAAPRASPSGRSPSASSPSAQSQSAQSPSAQSPSASSQSASSQSASSQSASSQSAQSQSAQSPSAQSHSAQVQPPRAPAAAGVGKPASVPVASNVPAPNPPARPPMVDFGFADSADEPMGTPGAPRAAPPPFVDFGLAAETDSASAASPAFIDFGFGGAPAAAPASVDFGATPTDASKPAPAASAAALDALPDFSRSGVRPAVAPPAPASRTYTLPPKAPAPAPVSSPAAAPAARVAAEPISQPLPEHNRAAALIAEAPRAPSMLTQAVAPTPSNERRAAGAPIFLKPPAQLDLSGPVIGIDLGTTNSCCAVLSGGKPVILKSRTGYNTIPSVVALNKQGKVIVGQHAKSQMLLNPKAAIYGAKRLVGRDFDSPTVNAVRNRFQYEILPGQDGKAAVSLGEHVVALEEIQGLILQECRQMAQESLGVNVSRAVVTCPAYYSEQQREAVRKAGALAGLKIERIINEPTAAALAYGLNRDLKRKVLVYDLGGGTFDATVLLIEKNVFEVLATGGDVFLGGLDFDNLIVDALLTKFEKQNGVGFAGDPVALSRMVDQAERAKVALSERTTAEIHLPMLQMNDAGAPLDLKCTLTRDELDLICKDLVDRTLETVRDVLLDAKLRPDQIDEVILVGGMSRMPLVRAKLKGMFNKSPHASVNADEAVALGAALFSDTIDKVSSVVLIDVVPMTIGIGLPGGGFKRLIERNTPLPVAISFGLATSKDNEERIELNVFQGEDSDVSVNDYLGTVRIDGLPKAPKGAVQVTVTLKLDAECVLHAEARELRTRRAVHATLATRYTSGEIANRLGITPAQTTAGTATRAAELKKRGGRFWGLLKKVLAIG